MKRRHAAVGLRNHGRITLLERKSAEYVPRWGVSGTPWSPLTGGELKRYEKCAVHARTRSPGQVQTPVCRSTILTALRHSDPRTPSAPTFRPLGRPTPGLHPNLHRDGVGVVSLGRESDFSGDVLPAHTPRTSASPPARPTVRAISSGVEDYSDMWGVVEPF